MSVEWRIQTIKLDMPVKSGWYWEMYSKDHHARIIGQNPFKTKEECIKDAIKLAYALGTKDYPFCVEYDKENE